MLLATNTVKVLICPSSYISPPWQCCNPRVCFQAAPPPRHVCSCSRSRPAGLYSSELEAPPRPNWISPPARQSTWQYKPRLHVKQPHNSAASPALNLCCEDLQKRLKRLQKCLERRRREGRGRREVTGARKAATPRRTRSATGSAMAMVREDEPFYWWHLLVSFTMDGYHLLSDPFNILFLAASLWYLTLLFCFSSFKKEAGARRGGRWCEYSNQVGFHCLWWWSVIGKLVIMVSSWLSWHDSDTLPQISVFCSTHHLCAGGFCVLGRLQAGSTGQVSNFLEDLHQSMTKEIAKSQADSYIATWSETSCCEGRPASQVALFSE